MNRNHIENSIYSLLIKRVFAFILSLAILLPVVLSTGLVGLCYTARLTGKTEVRVEDSFTLRLALDSGAYGFQGVLEYDSSVLKLSNAKPVNGKYQKEFHVYADTGLIIVTHDRPVTQLLNLTFYVQEDAEIGSSTTIRFTSGEILNETSDEKLEDVSITVKIVDTKSSDATLKSLVVTAYQEENDSNGFILTINPDFDSKTTLYSATVPNEYSSIRIEANPNDSKASVKAELDCKLQEGMNTIPLIVLAEDGTEMEYTLMLFRERPPEISQVIPDESSAETDSSNEEPTPSEEPSSSESSEGEESDPEESFEEGSISEDVSPEESVDTSSAVISMTTSSESNFFKPYQPEESNWTGIIIGIAVVGGVCLVALVVRLWVIYRKKQGV